MHLRKRIPKSKRPLVRVDVAPFPRFTDFPPEIRALIWSHAVESRVVHLYQERLKVDPSLYCQVRSDGEPPEPFDVSRRVRVVWLSRALEKQMALALGSHGRTMGTWLQFNDGWEPKDTKQFHGKGIKRSMPGTYVAGVAGPSHYTVRFQDDIAEVEWEERSTEVPEAPQGFKRTSPVPALLLACRESHAVASPLYKRILGTLGCSAEIYFSVCHDVLHIDESTFISNDSWMEALKALSMVDLRTIKSLSLTLPDPSHYDESEQSEDMVGDILGIFGAIEQLSLVSFPQGPLLDYIKAPAGDLILRDASDFDLQRIESQSGYSLFYNPGTISPRQLERARLKWKKSLRWRREELGIPSLRPWSMPVIDYKLLLTPQIAQDIRDLCQDAAAPTTAFNRAETSAGLKQDDSHPSSSKVSGEAILQKKFVWLFPIMKRGGRS